MNAHVLAVRYACGVQDSSTEANLDWCNVTMCEDYADLFECLSDLHTHIPGHAAAGCACFTQATQ